LDSEQEIRKLNKEIRKVKGKKIQTFLEKSDVSSSRHLYEMIGK